MSYGQSTKSPATLRIQTEVHGPKSWKTTTMHELCWIQTHARLNSDPMLYHLSKQPQQLFYGLILIKTFAHPRDPKTRIQTQVHHKASSNALPLEPPHLEVLPWPHFTLNFCSSTRPKKTFISFRRKKSHFCFSGRKILVTLETFLSFFLYIEQKNFAAEAFLVFQASTFYGASKPFIV